MRQADGIRNAMISSIGHTQRRHDRQLYFNRAVSLP